MRRPGSTVHGAAIASLFAMFACSGSAERHGESDCEALARQICEKWNEEKPPTDGDQPCNPPRTSPVDFTAACAKADERCGAPSSAITCAPGSQ